MNFSHKREFPRVLLEYSSSPWLNGNLLHFPSFSCSILQYDLFFGQIPNIIQNATKIDLMLMQKFGPARGLPKGPLIHYSRQLFSDDVYILTITLTIFKNIWSSHWIPAPISYTKLTKNKLMLNFHTFDISYWRETNYIKNYTNHICS